MESPRRPFCGALGLFPRAFAADSDSGVAEEPRWAETGWDRLRKLFAKDENQRISQELDSIYRAALAAGVIGWAYGGIPAFIHAKKRYIEKNQGEIYHNRLDAVQSAHQAAIRGFIRYGWRWSWRTALFVTMFNTVTSGLSVYQNKNFLNHFVIAGAVTGSLFRINLGMRGLVAGGIIGALFGLPVGSLLMALQSYVGETVQERKEDDVKAFRELKLKEWKDSLKITELLPEEIESGLQKNRAEEDVKKIDALLSLPRNPSSPDKQDKD